MTRYAADSRDRVRDAVDMVDLVSKRTELRRAGADHYSGLCPFHDERTPSFGISPSKKVFHCFGCAQSGDLFDFVMETEGLDFVAAMESLADRYGVTLEREDEDPQAAEVRRGRERLSELLDRTAEYYARYLWDSDEASRARSYLEERGLGREVLERFRVGFAPSAWDKVITGSLRRGFSAREVWEAGLASRSRQGAGRLYDRFRGRIMFPLSDRRGHVLGFGARALRDNQQPKYLNTADNDVYHKGRQLFGAHLARVEAAREGAVVVVEGYTDVLALHQAGIANTVGIMGTALTAEQVVELSALAPVVALALDADGAGREAMLRVAQTARGKRIELRVVALPAGMDPADLVRARGVEEVRSLVEGSIPFVRFHVEQILSAPLEGAERKDAALADLRAVLAGLGPSVMREELIRLAADRLDLSQGLVASLLEGTGRAATADWAPGRRDGRGGSAHGLGDAGETSGGGGHAPRAPLSQAERTERTFLALCIALPDPGREALRRVDLERHFSSERTRRAAAYLRDHITSPIDGLTGDDPDLTATITELAVRAEREPALPATLEAQQLDLELRRLEREIANANADGRLDITTLAEQRSEVKARFDRAIDKATENADGG
ncbi:MAG: DNA primase [Solirubrobacteraceae bacterium]